MNSEICNRHIHLSLDQDIESTDKILLQLNLDEKVGEIKFHQTGVNCDKNSLDRRSMSCLQQPQSGGNSNNWWLNDELQYIHIGLLFNKTHLDHTKPKAAFGQILYAWMTHMELWMSLEKDVLWLGVYAIELTSTSL